MNRTNGVSLSPSRHVSLSFSSQILGVPTLVPTEPRVHTFTVILWCFCLQRSGIQKKQIWYKYYVCVCVIVVRQTILYTVYMYIIYLCKNLSKPPGTFCFLDTKNICQDLFAVTPSKNFGVSEMRGTASPTMCAFAKGHQPMHI